MIGRALPGDLVQVDGDGLCSVAARRLPKWNRHRNVVSTVTRSDCVVVIAVSTIYNQVASGDTWYLVIVAGPVVGWLNSVHCVQVSP